VRKLVIDQKKFLHGSHSRKSETQFYKKRQRKTSGNFSEKPVFIASEIQWMSFVE